MPCQLLFEMPVPDLSVDFQTETGETLTDEINKVGALALSLFLSVCVCVHSRSRICSHQQPTK